MGLEKRTLGPAPLCSAPLNSPSVSRGLGVHCRRSGRWILGSVRLLSRGSNYAVSSYGVKIRAPHALVMTFLFRSGSLREKLRAILQATYTHSWNLARFVFFYKGLCALQSHVQGEPYQAHSFVSAFIGGLLVFGNNSNINSQISMYLLSRVLFALCRLGVEKGFIPKPKLDPFPLFTGLVWGLVLWLFEYHRATLQPSLQSSMTYLYEDSNVWHDLSDFLIYNKSQPSK
ncbi:peroxisomal membrane protein 4 isoform X1 [Moschus berezovskii]|uniref:peroxisomal membrane protein 4 isoform X1 n=1 Tax=Moschus berezovskii TaxID=68408 RepID=UPI002444C1F6|nr:peroxisomal membrane protein 4 isoform X1 [Moschus berezovskii]